MQATGLHAAQAGVTFETPDVRTLRCFDRPRIGTTENGVPGDGSGRPGTRRREDFIDGRIDAIVRFGVSRAIRSGAICPLLHFR